MIFITFCYKMSAKIAKKIELSHNNRYNSTKLDDTAYAGVE